MQTCVVPIPITEIIAITIDFYCELPTCISAVNRVLFMHSTYVHQVALKLYRTYSIIKSFMHYDNICNY